MAAEKTAFPVIPLKHWWSLRHRFRKSIPSKVDARYLASVLAGMSEGSAQANIIPSLRAMGLIDDHSKPTELAVKWRDDSSYPEVCQAIRKNVYPKQLLEVASGTDDREAARRWFASHSGGGESIVNKATAVYMLLCEADPAKAKGNADQPSQAPAGRQEARTKPPRRERKSSRGEESGNDALRSVAGPALHLNVQVHISPDATADQIDQIFASMGKHLKQLSA